MPVSSSTIKTTNSNKVSFETVQMYAHAHEHGKAHIQMFE